MAVTLLSRRWAVALWLLALAGPAAADNQRALYIDLAGSIAGAASGDFTTGWADLLTQELPSEAIGFGTACVGQSRVECVLQYGKDDTGTISVTGTLRLRSGRDCNSAPVAAEMPIVVSIPSDQERVVPFNLDGAGGSEHASGTLVFRNTIPPCSARHVRVKSTLRVRDFELLGHNHHGQVDTLWTSMLLEPDEQRFIASGKCVDHDVLGFLISTVSVTAGAELTVTSELAMKSSCRRDDDVQDLHTARFADTSLDTLVVAPYQTGQQTLGVGGDGDRVDATVFAENHGVPACVTAVGTVVYDGAIFDLRCCQRDRRGRCIDDCRGGRQRRLLPLPSLSGHSKRPAVHVTAEPSPAKNAEADQEPIAPK